MSSPQLALIMTVYDEKKSHGQERSVLFGSVVGGETTKSGCDGLLLKDCGVRWRKGWHGRKK